MSSSLDDDDLADKVIKRMIFNQCHIYKTIEDSMKDINRVYSSEGFEEPLDSPYKKYKVYIEWSDDRSLISQIVALKKIYPITKYVKNAEILENARHHKRWKICDTFINEAHELESKGKESDLNILIEDSD